MADLQVNTGRRHAGQPADRGFRHVRLRPRVRRNCTRSPRWAGSPARGSRCGSAPGTRRRASRRRPRRHAQRRGAAEPGRGIVSSRMSCRGCGSRARRIIANIAGNTPEEYREMAERLSDTDVDMIEMNISCPNVKQGGVQFGTTLRGRRGRDQRGAPLRAKSR